VFLNIDRARVGPVLTLGRPGPVRGHSSGPCVAFARIERRQRQTMRILKGHCIMHVSDANKMPVIQNIYRGIVIKSPSRPLP
jgi:hypothetical protein